MVNLNFIVNTVFSSKTYIIQCNGVGGEKDCWIVDCGDVDKVMAMGLNVRGVLLTHVHYDHIYGLNRLLSVMPNAVVYTNADGYVTLQNPRLNLSRYHTDAPDFILEHNKSVQIIETEGTMELAGGLEVEVLFTPGHTPNSISYIIGNCLFTGDAYIPGIKVVTALPRSNKDDAQKSLERLKALECRGLMVLSGHETGNLVE